MAYPQRSWKPPVLAHITANPRFPKNEPPRPRLSVGMRGGCGLTRRSARASGAGWRVRDLPSRCAWSSLSTFFGCGCRPATAPGGFMSISVSPDRPGSPTWRPRGARWDVASRSRTLGGRRSDTCRSPRPTTALIGDLHVAHYVRARATDAVA